MAVALNHGRDKSLAFATTDSGKTMEFGSIVEIMLFLFKSGSDMVSDTSSNKHDPLSIEVSALSTRVAGIPNRSR